MEEAIQQSVVYEGVNDQGFGTVPRRVMVDPSLSVESKGIYAYLASHAGAGEEAFPSWKRIVEELGISKSTFYKRRDELVQAGYLKVEDRSEGVRRPKRKVVYVLVSSLPKKDGGEEPMPVPEDGTLDAEKGQDAPAENVENNSEAAPAQQKSFQQSPGQVDFPKFQECLETGNDCEKDETPAQLDFPNFKEFLKTGNAPIDNNNQISKPGKINHPSIQSKQIRKEGAPDVDAEFDELAAPDMTVNRNRITDGRTDYAKLRESFPKETIFAAWAAEQGRCEGRHPRYYTNLAKWLSGKAAGECAALAARKDESRSMSRQEAMNRLMRDDESFKALVQADLDFRAKAEMVAITDEAERAEAEARVREIAARLDEAMGGR